jgi:hypothetical protein
MYSEDIHTLTRLNKILSAQFFYLSQPSDYCVEWKNEVSDNPDTTKEYRAFKKGPEMTSVIQSVSNRLGFTSSISYSMYAMF